MAQENKIYQTLATQKILISRINSSLFLVFLLDLLIYIISPDLSLNGQLSPEP